MSEKPFDLVKAARDIDRSDMYDRIRTGFLALSEFIPTLNTLLSEYLPDWKTERIRCFLVTLAKNVEELEDKFDQQAATTEEYGLLLEHVCKQVAQTSGPEKLKAYRAILLNNSK